MAALPKILNETPQSYYEEYNAKLAEGSNYIYEKIKNIRGIKPIKATAAMYMMIGIDFGEMKGIEDDLDFCLKLFNEEAVITIPSYCFFEKGFFRIVSHQSISFIYF